MKSFEERFWNKVDKSSSCWIWTAYRNHNGYGHFGTGKVRLAHRISWELKNGAIPDGLCVLHKCDNPPCVNPSHLFLGTRAENMADMVSKGRSNQPRGEGNSNAKLTLDDVEAIRTKYAAGGIHQKTLAEEYGVKQANISRITRHETWRKKH